MSLVQAPSAISRLRITVAEAQIGAAMDGLDVVEKYRALAAWIATRMVAAGEIEREFSHRMFRDLVEEERQVLLSKGGPA